MLGRKLVAEIVTHERRRDSTLKRSLLFLYKLALFKAFIATHLKEISKQKPTKNVKRIIHVNLLYALVCTNFLKLCCNIILIKKHCWEEKQRKKKFLFSNLKGHFSKKNFIYIAFRTAWYYNYTSVHPTNTVLSNPKLCLLGRPE